MKLITETFNKFLALKLWERVLIMLFVASLLANIL